MRKLLMIITSLAAVAAFAEGKSSGSEYFHQAAAGATEGTANLLYSSKKVTFSAGGGDSTDKHEIISYQVEHGLNDMLSLGGVLAYQTGKITSTGSSDADKKGLNDLDLFLKGNMAAGPGALKYRLDLGIATGDMKTDSSGDMNTASGGNHLTPKVGYEMAMGAGTGLVYVSTRLDIGKAKQKDDTVPSTDKYTGNNPTNFGLVYEADLNSDCLIGGNFDYETVSDYDFDNAGKSDGLSKTMTLSVYTRHNVGPGALLPKLSYATSSDDKYAGSDIDSASGFELSVGYRMAF
jgi:hypothetical protein